MRFGGMRRSLAIAMALLLSGRALALALGCIGGLAVLLLLRLQLHLTLLHSLGLGSLLHGKLLRLLRVHARPKASDIARRLLLATEGGRVDKVGRGSVVAVGREKHGRRHGGLLGLVEVHAHLRVDVNTRRPAIAKASLHVHVDSRVEAIHHLGLHGHALDASEREADLLLVLVVVVARSVEVLALLGLVEGREGVPVLVCGLGSSIGAR